MLICSSTGSGTCSGSGSSAYSGAGSRDGGCINDKLPGSGPERR